MGEDGEGRGPVEGSESVEEGVEGGEPTEEEVEGGKPVGEGAEDGEPTGAMPGVILRGPQAG